MLVELLKIATFLHTPLKTCRDRQREILGITPEMATEGGAGGKRKATDEQGEAHDTGDTGSKAARHDLDVHGKGLHGPGARGGDEGPDVMTFECASFREPYASVSTCTHIYTHIYIHTHTRRVR